MVKSSEQEQSRSLLSFKILLFSQNLQSIDQSGLNRKKVDMPLPKPGLYVYLLFPEPVDGRRQGGPWDAEEDVHPSGLPLHGRAVDAEGRLLPQAEVDEQHQRQTRIREYRLFCQLWDRWSFNLYRYYLAFLVEIWNRDYNNFVSHSRCFLYQSKFKFYCNYYAFDIRMKTIFLLQL